MSAIARSNRNTATAHAARLFPMRRIEGRKLTAEFLRGRLQREGVQVRGRERTHANGGSNSYIALCLRPYPRGCTATL